MSSVEIDPNETLTCAWKWKIPNFSQNRGRKTAIMSPTFLLENGIQKTVFIMNALKPNDKIEYRMILFFISDHDAIKRNSFVKVIDCSFAICTADFKEKFVTWAAKECNNNPHFRCHFIKQADLFANAKEYLPNDKLTILCKLRYQVKNEVEKDKVEKDIIKFTVPEYQRDEPFKSLIEDKKIGDFITVKNNNEEYQVIKGILAFHSPVFKAMFDHKETKEVQENLIEIIDMEHDVFKHMLQFMYADKLPESNCNYRELLAASECYQIARLKALCEKTLYKELNIENAAGIFVYACTYNAQQLRVAVKEFIIKRIVDVRKTNGFVNMKISHPQLAIEILEEPYEQQDKKRQRTSY